MAESPFTLRLPPDLRRLVEIEAKKHGQSMASYIVGACWAQLERHGLMVGPTAETIAPSLTDAGVAIAAKTKPDKAALRDICAGKGLRPAAPAEVAESPVEHEIPICGKTWWEDGEHWECLMDKGHREFKHGLRGMVRRLDV